MDLYRVFVWDGVSDKNKMIKEIYPPRLKQGAGRHDIPERDGVIYCSTFRVSAIADILQGFRGAAVTNEVYRCPDGRMRALARLSFDEKTPLLNLDDPKTLQKQRLKPSQVATLDRATTQNIARTLYDSGMAGFTWWSSLEASWTNVTLFASRALKHLTIVEVRELSNNLPEVIEAASALKINLAKT